MPQSASVSSDSKAGCRDLRIYSSRLQRGRVFRKAVHSQQIKWQKKFKKVLRQKKISEIFQRQKFVGVHSQNRSSITRLLTSDPKPLLTSSKPTDSSVCTIGSLFRPCALQTLCTFPNGRTKLLVMYLLLFIPYCD
jgi:hypothetical protein